MKVKAIEKYHTTHSQQATNRRQDINLGIVETDLGLLLPLHSLL
jgi:hypothetical protein